MRINTPINTNEIILADDSSIVSTTDLQGNIKYANPYFIEVSGYTESELIGAPQNILRHPDMPEAAFADLWATIKAGLPWTGMVKNRTKSGDFYWVMANVTPVIENGAPVGYISVRVKPSRHQVNEAEQLYRSMRDGNPQRISIRQGEVVESDVKRMWAWITDVSLASRLAIGMGVTAFTSLLCAVFLVSSNPLLAALSLFGVFLNLYLWLFLRSALSAPLKMATQAAQAMAGGDLTFNIQTDRKDEMGQLLRALRQVNVNLHSIIGDVRHNLAEISHASKEIANGNLDLSGRTESQASALEETASSMEELASTVQQNAVHAKHANGLASNASGVAEQGGVIVDDVIHTIGEISSSSQRIVDIISIIDGIAFQTNILALNAAVEAARAGEQGRGFAVVASEVRSLAQRSSAAAKDIKQLIELSVGKVQAGTVLAERAGGTMNNIISSIHQVTHIMSDIASASDEQSQGIGQVNEAITQMDDVTQQNAALVEQAAAAASSLDEQSYRLLRAMEIFKLKQVSRVAPAQNLPRKATAAPRLSR
jgi:aerotaxis receptor